MFCSNLIPHTDFYKGYWFRSESCSWYHFYLTTRKFSNNTSQKFYNSVDKNLVELIKLLHFDNRMNIDEILSLIEKHWGYTNIQQYVEFKENFFQWEIERLIHNTDEYTMKELVLK